MMFDKNRNKKVGLCVMVVAACLVMAAVWAVLATPETALAVKPDKPGKPGGGGEGTSIFFDVLLGMDSGDIFMVYGSGIEGRIESIGGGTNIDRMIVNRPSPHINITSVIEDVVEDQQDAECFGGSWVDEKFVGEFVGEKGTLLIELPDRAVNEMTVAYGFIAKDTKGKEVPYTISTTGTLVEEEPFGDKADWIAVQDAVNDGTADPEVIPKFFVQVAGETSWELSKSGSQKFACTGSGDFESGFGIRIINPRSEKQNNTLSP